LIVQKTAEVRIFSKDIIEGMLHVALEQELEFVPFPVFGVFAGLRVGGPELLHLPWTQVHLDEKVEIGDSEG
jgi:hypothetical protein